MTLHGYPAAALLACWATQVELDRPLLRRCPSRQRPPQPNTARPGSGGEEVEHRRTAYARGSSPRSARRSVVAAAGPPTGASVSTLQGACCWLLLAPHCIPSATGTDMVDFGCGLPSYILRIQKRVALILNL